jgi:hypothetical protein
MSNEEHYFGRKCLPVETPAEKQQLAMEDIYPFPPGDVDVPTVVRKMFVFR